MAEPVLRRSQVDLCQPLAECRNIGCRAQVGFGNQHAVGKADLPTHHRVFGQLGVGVDRVNHGNDAIQPVGVNQFMAGKKGLGNRGGVGQAGGFNHQAVKRQFACGPLPMLRALSDATGDIPGELSFEERMGCGFGGCMGCSCQTKNGAKRICKEGPVLKKEEIIW